jgi:hypothetical protein
MGILIALAGVAAVAALLLAAALRRHRREAFVRSFRLPPGLFVPLQAKHPQLALRDCELVARGLRQFFLAYLKSGRRPVAMPSQVADDLWHEFILHTRAYEAFCRQAFGGFLHHTPAVALGSQAQHDAGLRRVWWHACRDETIDPRQPSRLPLLFALDTKFGIAGGFRYVPDCRAPRREDTGGGGPVHCGGDFATAGGGDAGGDGFGDGDGGGDGGGGGCGGD